VLVAVLALAAGAWAPSTARAVTTFGSSLPAPSAGYYDSCSDACTTAQVDLPGAQTRSPVDETIVRYRLRTGAGSDAQQVRFRVLRSSDGVSFTGVGTSAAFALPTTAGVTEFPVSMPVRAGDHIGIDQPGGSKRAVIVAQNPDAFQAGWFPTLADDGQARPSGNPQGSGPTRYDLLLQADVEPSPTAPPTPPVAPKQPPNCTSSKQVATCSDLSQPAMCGPTSLGFPQCSLPFSLPTACSGTGTGLPTCGNADPEFAAYAEQHHDAASHNYVTFNYRARELILDYLKSDLHSGYSGDPFQPLGSSAAPPIAALLSSKAPQHPGVSFGSYEDPIDLSPRGGRRARSSTR
jgi:hypothetical protein